MATKQDQKKEVKTNTPAPAPTKSNDLDILKAEALESISGLVGTLKEIGNITAHHTTLKIIKSLEKDYLLIQDFA